MYRMLLKQNVPFDVIFSPKQRLDKNLLGSLLYQSKKVLNPGFNNSFLIPKISKTLTLGECITTQPAWACKSRHPGIMLAEKYTVTYSHYFLTKKSHNIYKFEFMSNFLKFKNKNFFIYNQSIIKKNIKNIFLLILNLGYSGGAVYTAPCLQLDGEISVFNNYGLKKKSAQRISKNKPLACETDITVILDLHENIGKISFYKSLGTPIIAITDHYTNPSVVDYPILVDKIDFFTKYFVFSALINLFLTGKSLKIKYYKNVYIHLKNLLFLNQAFTRSLLKVSIYK